MSGRCAFEDCGDPACRVCWWGRQTPARDQDEGKRAQVALPKAKATPSPTAPKRRHREGPHR